MLTEILRFIDITMFMIVALQLNRVIKSKKDTSLDKKQAELLNEAEALNNKWKDLNNQMHGKLEQITEYINSLKKG